MIRKNTMKSQTPTLFCSPVCAAEKVEKNTIGVVGMPTDWTHSSRIGSRFGPLGLRRATSDLMETTIKKLDNKVIDTITNSCHRKKDVPLMFDCGNSKISPESPAETTESIAKMTETIRKRGAIPLALGGDHYNSFPACLGYARALEEINPNSKFGYIQIDGHLDFSDRLGAWGEMNHATNGRRISELPNISVSNMVWIGISGWVDSEEFGLIEEMGGKVFSSDDIRRYGTKKIAELALEHASKGVEHIYLSIDVDATDAGFLPGTGSIVQSKVTPKQIVELMDVFADAPIDGIDIVEVAPDLDPSGRSEQISGYYLLRLLRKYIFQNL